MSKARVTPTIRKALSVFTSFAFFVSASTASFSVSAWEGWGDEGAALNPVTQACGNGAIGNFSVFEGSEMQGCDWVGTFAMVECLGGGVGRVTRYEVVRIRQNGPGCGGN